eukprot:GGOE01040756.1.p1 GENE.GGOE01040756.1~~GGOE01040756.1.p1  ORF type:complete len:513 (-),score=153.63 GGOE01040756.1:207-1745(-)
MAFRCRALFRVGHRPFPSAMQTRQALFISAQPCTVIVPLRRNQVRFLSIPGQEYVVAGAAMAKKGTIAAAGVVKQATLAGASGVKSGAIVVGSAVKSGTLATGSAVKSGTLATGSAIKSGAAYVGAGAVAGYAKVAGWLQPKDEVLPGPQLTGHPTGLLPPDVEDFPEPEFSIFETVDDWFMSIPSFNPMYYLSAGITGLHTAVGLPWWLSFFAVAFTFRLVMLVPMIISQKQLALKTCFESEPEVVEINKRLGTLKANTKENAALRTKLDAQKKDLNARLYPSYSTWKWVVPYGVNALTWGSIFYAVRGIIQSNPTVKDGGILWFENLAEVDPMYLLPLASWLMQGTAAEINYARNPNQMGSISQDTSKTMLRVGLHCMLFFFSFFVGARMPAGIVIFWVTTASFAVVQNLILFNPSFRKWYGIPDRKPKLTELKKEDYNHPPSPTTIRGTNFKAIDLPVYHPTKEKQTAVAHRVAFKPPQPAAAGTPGLTMHAAATVGRVTQHTPGASER